VVRAISARHQTLHNAIAWSYDLLNESEQTLFQRLSVLSAVALWTRWKP
jgi:predicted ATPase